MRNMRRAEGAPTEPTSDTSAPPIRAGTASRALLACAGLIAVSTAVTGCAAPAPTPKQQLTVAYHDLDQRQYDSAYLKADAVLTVTPPVALIVPMLLAVNVPKALPVMAAPEVVPRVAPRSRLFVESVMSAPAEAPSSEG